MKKIIYVLMFISMISLVMADGFPTSHGCTENDDGEDIYEKSSISATGKGWDTLNFVYCASGSLQVTNTDTCVQWTDNYVKEYFCTDEVDDWITGDEFPIYFENSNYPCIILPGESLAYYYEERYCENGCYDGACIEDEGIADVVDRGEMQRGNVEADVRVGDAQVAQVQVGGVEVGEAELNTGYDFGDQFVCRDSDASYDNVYEQPGKVSCKGPVLETKLTLVDGCITQGNSIYLREYFAEECANCEIHETISGSYTITVYYEDYACGSLADGYCMTNGKGTGYCTLEEEEETFGRGNFLTRLKGAIVGRFFMNF